MKNTHLRYLLMVTRLALYNCFNDAPIYASLVDSPVLQLTPQVTSARYRGVSQYQLIVHSQLKNTNCILQLPNIWVFWKNYTDGRDCPWSIVGWKNSNRGQSKRYKAKSCCKGLSTWCECTHCGRWSPSSYSSRCCITCNKSYKV